MARNKQRFSPFVRQCFVSGAVCSSAMSQSCATGFPGVLLPQLKLGEEAESWIASVMALAIFLGLGAASPLMGRLGRKIAAYVVISTNILSWVVLAMSANLAVIIIGRTLQGISFGLQMPLRGTMIGEYTSPKYRGGFLTTISLSQSIGIVFVHFVGSHVHWQYTAIVCCCFPLISFIMTIYSPESPSWLAVRGRYDECRDAFRWLRGDAEETELEKMISERMNLEQQNENEKEDRVKKFKVVARKKEVYKPVIIAVHIFLLAQLSGALTLTNYPKSIIDTMMGKGANDFWMVQLDILRLIANVLAVFLIAKVPRRTVLFSTGFLCVASHAAISVYVYLKLRNLLSYDANWIPAMLLNLQVAAMGFGIVPMGTILTGEIFPLEYRSILGSLSAVIVTGAMFVTLKTFPSLYNSLGLDGTYAVYFGILSYNLMVIWFMLPETKGKTLQEIEEHFRDSSAPKDREMVPLKNEQKTSEEA